MSVMNNKQGIYFDSQSLSTDLGSIVPMPRSSRKSVMEENLCLREAAYFMTNRPRERQTRAWGKIQPPKLASSDLYTLAMLCVLNIPEPPNSTTNGES